MYGHLQKCLYKGLCPKLSTNITIVMLHVVMPRFANFSLQERIFYRAVFIDTLMYVFGEYRIVRLESVLHCINF